MKVLALTLLAASPGAWKLVEKKDGIELYERELPGERLVDLKAVTVSKLSVEALCTSAYGTDKLDPKDEPEVKLRKLISNDDGVRITYEQVSAPVVSDRDYAVSAVREALPGGGCRTHFEAANQHAPKLPDGFVRIEKLRGGWTFEPMPDGNVVCTYTIFTDPGGMIPGVLIEGTRKKTAFNRVKLMLERAARVGDAGR
jgi:hypothetical protein